MKIFFIILSTFLIQSCNKPKTVLICGNHVCVNKAEAEQYFEENLSIEVRLIDKKEINKTDLVELNLQKQSNDKRKISIISKKQTNKEVKVLSKNEIKKIKKNIKYKKKTKKITKKVPIDINTNVKRRINKEVVDVCTIIEKCSIDNITKYLLDQGRKKKFPDITTRE